MFSLRSPDAARLARQAGAIEWIKDTNKTRQGTSSHSAIHNLQSSSVGARQRISVGWASTYRRRRLRKNEKATMQAPSQLREVCMIALFVLPALAAYGQRVDAPC